MPAQRALEPGGLARPGQRVQPGEPRRGLDLRLLVGHERRGLVHLAIQPHVGVPLGRLAAPLGPLGIGGDHRIVQPVLQISLGQPPASVSTLASTVRASSSGSTLVASAMAFARSRSMRPAASAAPVAGSRQVSVMPRSAQVAAL